MTEENKNGSNHWRYILIGGAIFIVLFVYLEKKRETNRAISIIENITTKAFSREGLEDRGLAKGHKRTYVSKVFRPFRRNNADKSNGILEQKEEEINVSDKNKTTTNKPSQAIEEQGEEGEVEDKDEEDEDEDEDNKNDYW